MAKKRKADPHGEAARLQKEMQTVSQSLKDAYLRFDYADDPDLIDACIYDINACKARYNYILRCLKACGGAPMSRPHAVPVPPPGGGTVAAAKLEGGDACLT